MCVIRGDVCLMRDGGSGRFGSGGRFGGGSEEGQQRGLVGERGWRRTGAMKKGGRDVLSVLPSRRSSQSRWLVRYH